MLHRDAYKLLVGKPEGKRPLGDLATDGKIFKHFFGIWSGKV
jgi:hypothetical protein